MNQDEIESLIASLNEIGESAVRERIAKGAYRNDKLPIINHWLDNLASERAKESSFSASEAAARKEVREIETLSIARNALRNSDRAYIMAIIAMVLSIIMAIQKIIEWSSIK